MRDGNHFSQHSGVSSTCIWEYRRGLCKVFAKYVPWRLPYWNPPCLSFFINNIVPYRILESHFLYRIVSLSPTFKPNRTLELRFSYGTNPNPYPYPYPYPFATIYIVMELLVYITYPEDLPYHILKSHFFIPYRNGLSTTSNTSAHTHTDPY